MGEVVKLSDALDRRERERMKAFGDEVGDFVEHGQSCHQLDRADAVFVIMINLLLELKDASEAGYGSATDILEWLADELSEWDVR